MVRSETTTDTEQREVKLMPVVIFRLFHDSQAEEIGYQSYCIFLFYRFPPLQQAPGVRPPFSTFSFYHLHTHKHTEDLQRGGGGGTCKNKEVQSLLVLHQEGSV